jgi:rhodanese-related sulfurtransferase
MAPAPRFQQLTADARTRVPEVSPMEASKRLSAGALLIDVRESEEFAQAHAQGAIHLSKGVLELRIEGVAPNPDTSILCYCGGGSRSLLAADNLKKMGYTNVASIAGGLRAWKEAGLPLE